MTDALKLMAVLAHPDDETLGAGPALAKYIAEGVEAYLLTATRGERGWDTSAADYPGEAELGRIREAELRAAGQVLGLREIQFLDYVDGELDKADSAEAVGRIVAHLRRVRPQVVVTFDPFGSYGHPDHIAICQFTTTACLCAADAAYGSGQPHRVSKLYYLVDRREAVALIESLIGKITFEVDGVTRGSTPWADWAITTHVNVDAHWQKGWQAAQRHVTQVSGWAEQVNALPKETQRQFWSPATFYRAYSFVNGGRAIEHDLFEGLRP